MGKVIAAIVIIAAIAAFVYFFFFAGKGFGTGKSGSGTGEDTVNSVAETVSAEAEPAQADVIFAEVTIKEGGYVYNGGEYQLDPLIEELKKLDEGTKVRITDDGGLVDAKNALTDALDGSGIPYTDDTAV